MCAIVDADVAHQVFSKEPTDAGRYFFDWVCKGKSRLVLGGLELHQLNRSGKEVRRMIQGVLMSGAARTVDSDRMTERVDSIRQEFQLKSNDPHIIALAQISGARLLYSDDKDLHKDFKNKDLIHSPRGNVYTTVNDPNGKLKSTHRRLLQNRALCGAACF